MGLLDLDNYINIVLAKILADQDLCKYIYYDVDQPLSQATITDTSILSDRYSADRRIFATPFDPDIHGTQQTSIHIELSQSERTDSTYYKSVNISFIILSHNHLWELYTADASISLRPNKIVSKLFELFNRQQSIGIGSPHFSEIEPIYFNDTVSGYKVTFENVDFTENT
jgi:hypothetical protein